jgi:hypothetical protein
VASEKGGQDPFGAYEIVKDWRSRSAGWPGQAKWTWGAGEGVFAETPEPRVSSYSRGLLPNMERPKTQNCLQFGPERRVPDRVGCRA